MWVTDDRWKILDTVFRIVSEDEEAAERIRGMFVEFDRTDRPARAAHILQIARSADGTLIGYNDCRRFSTVRGEWDDFLTSAVAVINNIAVERCPHFAVHSAVVSNGRSAIALPASTGGGKSTLAGSLVKVGFSYMSDEALIVNDSGDAMSYPKPIALSPWSAEKLGLSHRGQERLAMPQDFDGSVEHGPLPLGDVVLIEKEHEDVGLVEIPRSEVFGALIQYSFNHYKDPERAFRLASDLARSARSWRLSYDDPLAAAALLAEKLS